MGTTVLGLGVSLCVAGAVAHFKENWRHREHGLALGGFCLLLIAMYMSQAGHF